MKETSPLQRWVPTLLSRTLIRLAIPTLIGAGALVKLVSPLIPPTGVEEVLWRQATICLLLALVLSLAVILDLLIYIRRKTSNSPNRERRPSRWQ